MRLITKTNTALTNRLVEILCNDFNSATISCTQKNGVACVYIYENGDIYYLTCEKASKLFLKDRKITVISGERRQFLSYYGNAHFIFNNEVYWLKVNDSDITVEELKALGFQQIKLGTLLNKVFYVVTKTKLDTDKTYTISYVNPKDRNENNVQLEKYPDNLTNEDVGEKYLQLAVNKWWVDELINKYYSYYSNNEFTVEIVQGDKIADYYWRKNYWRTGKIDVDWSYDNYTQENNGRELSQQMDEGLVGDLKNSCMRYGGCEEYLDIYVKNPQVSLAVIFKDDLIAARCIIWNEKKYYDRVYAIDDIYKNALINHLQKLDYKPCFQQGIKDKIELSNTKFNHYPYADTFRYLNISSNTLYSYEPNCTYVTLDCTDGEYSVEDEEEEDNTVYSEYHGYDIDRNNAIWLEYRDSYVHRDSTVIDIDRIDRLKDDTYYSEYLDEYIYEDYAISAYIESKGQLIEDWVTDKTVLCYSKVLGIDIVEEFATYIKHLEDYVPTIHKDKYLTVEENITDTVI